MRGRDFESGPRRVTAKAAVWGVVFSTLLFGVAVAGGSSPPDPTPETPAYDNSYAKDFIMDAPWRVVDASTAIPLMIVLKDCDADDVRQLHWIRCWDVTGGGNTILWDHNFGDERIGDDATEANFWTYITTVTEGHASLPNGTLMTPASLGYGAGAAIQLKVSIYYKDDLFNYTETRYLRVHVGGGAYPWPGGWYGGDTHYHTMYTNNTAESGAPIPAVRRAAAAMGLHWLITTDHSCDLDETGDGMWSYATPAWEYTLQTPAGIQTVTRDNGAFGSSWGAIGADIAAAEGPDLRLVRGEEVNLASVDGDSQDKTLHAVFANNDYLNSPLSGSLGESPVTPDISDGMGQLAGAGFAFAAHPIANLGVAVNGAPWGDQDIETSLGFPHFLGLEAFNTRELLTSTNETNPWADFDAGSAAGNPYPAELLAGIRLWDGVLRSNLEAPIRKVFLTGGSDAHGDFNYATYLSLDTYATDNAIGKVQTVAQVPGAYAPGNLPPVDAIVEAIRAGRTVITDGPFLEIGLDRDSDGDWYEPEDLQIGGDGAVTAGMFVPMRIRWSSLTEFGPITSITLFAGDAAATTPIFQLDPSSMGQGYGGATLFNLGGLAYSGYRYFRAECLTADGAAGHRAYTNPIWITFDAPSLVAEGNAPPAVSLDRCSPNPFTGETRISFTLADAGPVGLRVLDAGGRAIRTVLDGRAFPAGRHEAVWDGRDDGGKPVATGVYFGVLRAGGKTCSAKMQLLR